MSNLRGGRWRQHWAWSKVGRGAALVAFEEAVLLSYQKSREGDIILLAPGCESYDMFVSYEERGNYFKKYVDEI